jgi:hypothetical protein
VKRDFNLRTRGSIIRAMSDERLQSPKADNTSLPQTLGQLGDVSGFHGGEYAVDFLLVCLAVYSGTRLPSAS